MNLLAKVLFRYGCPLLALMAVHLTIFATVDDAQAFALQAAESYVKQGFQVREDYWGGDLGSGEKKAVRQQLFKGNEYWFWMGTEVERARKKPCANSCSKETNTGSGWALRWNERGSQSTFTIRTANWRSSRTAGRKVISPRRISFQKAPAVISLSWQWKNRRRNARTGRWSTASANAGCRSCDYPLDDRNAHLAFRKRAATAVALRQRSQAP